MATITHLQWLDAMLGGGVHPLSDLLSDTIGVSLLDEADSGTILNTFVDYAEVNAAVVVYSTTITVSSTTAGVATLSAPTTMSAVSGDVSEFVTVFSGTTAATSPLILTWDSASAGLPVTPNSGDIIATWGSNTLVTLS